MSKLGWGFGGGLEVMSFKRRPDGWLFAAPYALPRRTYLVTDEQKGELIKPLRRMQWTITSSSLIITAGLLILLHNQPRLNWLLIVAIAVAMIFILSSVYSTIAIRPLLAGMPRTSDKITLSDKFMARTAVMPKAVVVGGAICSIMLFAAGLAMGLMVQWDSAAITTSTFFGAMTLFYLVIFRTQQLAKGRM